MSAPFIDNAATKGDFGVAKEKKKRISREHVKEEKQESFEEEKAELKHIMEPAIIFDEFTEVQFDDSYHSLPGKPQQVPQCNMNILLAVLELQGADGSWDLDAALAFALQIDYEKLVSFIQDGGVFSLVPRLAALLARQLTTALILRIFGQYGHLLPDNDGGVSARLERAREWICETDAQTAPQVARQLMGGALEKIAQKWLERLF